LLLSSLLLFGLFLGQFLHFSSLFPLLLRLGPLAGLDLLLLFEVFPLFRLQLLLVLQFHFLLALSSLISGLLEALLDRHVFLLLEFEINFLL